jgi:hypothetical protein
VILTVAKSGLSEAMLWCAPRETSPPGCLTAIRWGQMVLRDLEPAMHIAVFAHLSNPRNSGRVPMGAPRKIVANPLMFNSVYPGVGNARR